MAHAISNRMELERWLSVTLGERDDIFRFASTHLGLTPEQVAELPRGESPAATVHGFVTFLERRGLTDALWPALLSAFPRRAADVHALRLPWEACEGQPQEAEDLAALVACYRARAATAWSPEPRTGRGARSRQDADPTCYVDLTIRLEEDLHLDNLSPEERRLFFVAKDGKPEIYTSHQARLDETREERHKAKDHEEAERLRVLPLQDTLERGGSWVLLGDPGSGKTTALRHLAARAAERSDGPLPIFARLDRVRIPEDDPEPTATLRAQLARQVGRDLRLPEIEGQLDGLLAAGPVLLLLDGLDECGDQEERERVATAAGLLLADLPSGSRLIASSRVVGYRDARLPGEVLHVRVAALSDEQVESLAQRWFAAQPASQDRSLAEPFLVALQTNPATRRLAETPLLLTSLMRLYIQDRALPEMRADLYEKILEDFLRKWPTRRSPSRHETEGDPELRFERHLLILERLALRFQEGREDLGHSKEEVNRLIEEVVKEEEPTITRAKLRSEAKRLFRELTQGAGALRERGRDYFSFQHRTLQEFLVGRALAEQRGDLRDVAVQERLDDPRWREPLLLCAGWLSLRWQSEPRAANLIERVLETIRSDEEILQLCLPFAAEMIVEISPTYRDGHGATVVERVVRALAQLLTDHQPEPLVKEALRRLCALARVGVAGAEQALIDAMARPACPVQDFGAVKAIGKQARETVVEFLRAADVPGLMYALLRHAGPDPDSEDAGAIFALAPTQAKARAAVLDWFGPDTRSKVKPEQVQHTGDTRRWPADLRDAHLSYALWRVTQPGGTPAHLTLHAADSAEARAAILALLRASENPRNVANAAQALGPAAGIPEVREALLETLAHPDPHVQALAAASLTSLARHDSEVRAALIGLASASAGEPRRAALEVLLRVGPRPDLLEVLGRGLPEAQDRRLLVSMLARPVWPAAIAVPLLVAGLRDPAAEVRQAAAQQAKEWGLPGGQLPPTLQPLLLKMVREEPSDTVRETALRTLGAFVTSSPEVRAELERQLTINELPSAAQAAVMSVLPLVPDDAASRDGVFALAAHPLPEVRRAVARALASVAREQGRATLFTLLKDPDDDTRAEAATALSRHLDDDEIRATLTSRAADLVRCESRALYQLARACPGDEEVRRVLRAGVDSEHPLRAALIALAAHTAGDGLLNHAAARLRGSPGLLLMSSQDWIDLDEATPRIAGLLWRQWRDTFRHADPRTLVAAAPHSDWIREMLRLNLCDDDPTVQARAVQALAASEDPVDRQALAPLWETTDPHLTAAMILHLSPLPAWREQLAARKEVWLRSEHGSVRAALACTLAQHPDLIEHPMPALRRLFLDELPWVRAWAALGLRHHLGVDPWLSDLLCPWLGASGRFWARDLRGPHFPYTAGVPMLWADDLRRALADALATYVPTTPTLQLELESMLESPDATTRQGATWTLWASGWERERLLPRLREVLDDRRCQESVLLRIHAARSLVGVLDRDIAARAHEALVAALSTGQEPWRDEGQVLGASPSAIRLRALEALAETHEPVSSETVLQVMRAACRDPNPKIRDAGWKALRRVREGRGQGTPAG